MEKKVHKKFENFKEKSLSKDAMKFIAGGLVCSTGAGVGSGRVGSYSADTAEYTNGALVGTTYHTTTDVSAAACVC